MGLGMGLEMVMEMVMGLEGEHLQCEGVRACCVMLCLGSLVFAVAR